MLKLLHRAALSLFELPRGDDQIPEGLDRDTYHVVDMIQLDRPAVDPGEQAIPRPPEIVIIDPDGQGINGQVILGWDVVPLPPPTPEPDWDALREGIQTENGFDGAFRVALAANPMIGTSLSSRLDAYQLNNNYTLFLQGLQQSLKLLESQQAAHIAYEFLTLAQRCNMPSDFLQALQNLLEQPTP